MRQSLTNDVNVGCSDVHVLVIVAEERPRTATTATSMVVFICVVVFVVVGMIMVMSPTSLMLVFVLLRLFGYNSCFWLCMVMARAWFPILVLVLMVVRVTLVVSLMVVGMIMTIVVIMFVILVIFLAVQMPVIMVMTAVFCILSVCCEVFLVMNQGLVLEGRLVFAVFDLTTVHKVFLLVFVVMVSLSDLIVHDTSQVERFGSQWLTMVVNFFEVNHLHIVSFGSSASSMCVSMAVVMSVIMGMSSEHVVCVEMHCRRSVQCESHQNVDQNSDESGEHHDQGVEVFRGLDQSHNSLPQQSKSQEPDDRDTPQGANRLCTMVSESVVFVHSPLG